MIKYFHIAGLIILFGNIQIAHAQQWVTQIETIYNLNNIQVVDNTSGYIVGQNGIVRKLTNYGQTMGNVDLASVELRGLCFNDLDTGWVVGGLGNINTTTSMGIQWDPPVRPYPDASERLNTCHYFKDNSAERIWVLGDNSMHRFEGESMPVQTDTGLSGLLKDVLFRSARNGFAATSSGIYRSTNGGLSWTPVQEARENMSELDIGPDGSFWAVGTNGTVLYLSDFQDTWQDASPNGYSNISFRSVTITPSGNVYVVDENATVILKGTQNQENLEWSPIPIDFSPPAQAFPRLGAFNDNHIWIVGMGGFNRYSVGEVKFESPLTPDDTLYSGADQTIEIINSFNSHIDLHYRLNPSDAWIPIYENHLEEDGVLTWQVPPANTTQAQLRVQTATTGKTNLIGQSNQLSDTVTFPIFINDLTPPFFPSPPATMPPQPASGQEITVNATIEDSLHSVEATLFYRVNGSKDFAFEKMKQDDQDPTLYHAPIPGQLVTNAGVEYYIQSNDLSVNRNDTTLNSAEEPGYIEIYTDGLEFLAASSSPGDGEIFQMISMPLDLVNSNIQETLEPFLGRYDQENWRLFRWNPTTEVYEELVGEVSISNPRFEPGLSYWLAFAPPSGDFPRSGRGHSVSSAEAAITLETGWNQVAIPYTFNTPVDCIERPDSLSGFYQFNNDEKKFDLVEPTADLEPYTGYFIHNSGNTPKQLTFPPKGTEYDCSSLTEPGSPDLEWAINLRVSYELEGDHHTIEFGQSKNSKDEIDQSDQLAPPSPALQPLEVILRSHLNEGIEFKRDIRSWKETGDEWTFKILSKKSGLVHLHFQLDELIPTDLDVSLVSLLDGRVQSLRENPNFSFISGSHQETKQFLLVVYPSDTQDTYFDVPTPAQTNLYQNFPNPFKESTTIRFGLSQDVPVSLRIFDLTGKEIATLIQEKDLGKGYHTLDWQAVGLQYNSLSNGIYFVRLETPGTYLTRKIILLK